MSRGVSRCPFVERSGRFYSAVRGLSGAVGPSSPTTRRGPLWRRASGPSKDGPLPSPAPDEAKASRTKGRVPLGSRSPLSLAGSRPYPLTALVAEEAPIPRRLRPRGSWGAAGARDGARSRGGETSAGASPTPPTTSTPGWRERRASQRLRRRRGPLRRDDGGSARVCVVRRRRRRVKGSVPPASFSSSSGPASAAGPAFPRRGAVSRKGPSPAPWRASVGGGAAGGRDSTGRGSWGGLGPPP